VLSSTARLRRSQDFTETVRQGARAGRSLLVVHLDVPSAASAVPPRAGFVVSRSVGGSVVRHSVLRRLRAVVRDRLDALPAGSRLVVRALPPAATASSADLGRDLDDALDAARRRLARGAARPADALVAR
jgi:ribonuclease P protein component